MRRGRLGDLKLSIAGMCNMPVGEQRHLVPGFADIEIC